MGIPLVALGVKPPQIENYQDLQARAAGIQNMRGQNALQPGQLQEQQQAIQGNQLQIEKEKRALADQDAMSKAMQEWDPKDINSLPTLVMKHGGSAQAVMGLKTGLLKMQTDTANLTKEQLGIEKIKNDHFAEALGNVLELPPEQQAQGFEAAKADSVKQGFMDPQHAQALQYQNPMQLASLRKVLLGHQAVMEETAKQATIAKEQQASKESEAKIAGEVAKGQESQQEAALGPEGRAKMKLLGEPAALEMSDWLKKNPGKGPADYARWHASLAPQAQVNVQMGAGGAGGPLTDATIDALAAPGAKLKLSDVLPPRAPLAVKQAAINQVLAKHPDFASSNYDIEKGVMKSAVSGDIGKNITAFNTAIAHANQLDKAVDALKNNDLRALNAIGNQLGFQTGSDATTNFNVIKNALAGEISKTFKGGQATDAEIKQVEEPFSTANSVPQLKGAIKTAIHLMNSKRDNLAKQVELGKQGKANISEDSGSSDTTAHPFFSKFGGTARP